MSRSLSIASLRPWSEVDRASASSLSASQLRLTACRNRRRGEASLQAAWRRPLTNEDKHCSAAPVGAREFSPRLQPWDHIQ